MQSPITILTYSLIIFAAHYSYGSEQREYVPPDEIVASEGKSYTDTVAELNKRYDGFYQLKQEKRRREQQRQRGAEAQRTYRRQRANRLERARREHIAKRKREAVDRNGEARHEKAARERALRRGKSRKVYIGHRRALERYRSTAKQVAPAEDVGLKP